MCIFGQHRDLAPGAGGVITVRGLLSATLAAGELNNVATIGSLEGDNDAGSNSSSASIVVMWWRVYLPLVVRER